MLKAQSKKLKGHSFTIRTQIKKETSYKVLQDRALKKCSVNIFSDRASWRDEGPLAPKGRTER